jgi:hypothetical protein
MHPSQPQPEDGYARGVDLVQILSREFGVSQMVVLRQLAERGVEVTVDGVPVKPERGYKLPYGTVKGRTLEVVGRDLHFRMQFQG